MIEEDKKKNKQKEIEWMNEMNQMPFNRSKTSNDFGDILDYLSQINGDKIQKRKYYLKNQTILTLRYMGMVGPKYTTDSFGALTNF